MDLDAWTRLDKTGSIYMARFSQLSEQYGFDWVDVFRESDIGRERLAVAQLFHQVRSNTSRLSGPCLLLEVGCGRGYFTTALSMTNRGAVTFALDRMNGYGREGWWLQSRRLWLATSVRDQVRGVRGDLARLPFTDGVFDAALSVHGLRNIQTQSRPPYISELARVTRPGGLVLIAEYTPKARTRAQGVFLDLFSMKTKLSGGDYPLPREPELRHCFEFAGMEQPYVYEIDMSIREPIWAFNIDSPRASADDRERYRALVSEARQHGVLTPPTLIVWGRKT